MAIEKSGLYYPNKIALIYIQVLEDIMGKNGLNSVLHAAGLDALRDNYPPDDLKREFDFADFAALNQALDDTYGPRGGRVFALRGGKAAIKAGATRDELAETVNVCVLMNGGPGYMYGAKVMEAVGKDVAKDAKEKLEAAGAVVELA